LRIDGKSQKHKWKSELWPTRESQEEMGDCQELKGRPSCYQLRTKSRPRTRSTSTQSSSGTLQASKVISALSLIFCLV